MPEVNQTPESPQVPEATEEKQTQPVPPTPELGGVFKGTNPKKSSKMMLWVYIVLGIIIVAGGGYFAWAKYGDTILTKLGVKKTETETTADKTVDWKTYTDSTYKFSFKYPKDWEQSSTASDTLMVFSASASKIAGNDFTVTISKDNIDIVKSDREKDNPSLSFSKITVGNKVAYKSAILQGIEGDIREVLVDVAPKTIKISAEGETLNDLDTILSTFKLTDVNLSFVTIAKGQYGGQTPTQQTIITDQSQLKKLWAEINSQRSSTLSLPEIDFSKYMVIAVVGGGGGGGDSIEITRINELNNIIEVTVKEKSAGKGCAVPAVITNSYHLIKLQKPTKEVTFIISPEVTDCSA